MSTPFNEAKHADFLRLFAENEAVLRTFIRSMVPTRLEASEILQEVAVALWQNLDQAVEFRPWAFGVARNMALQHLRSRTRDRHVFSDDLVNRLADRAVELEQQHLTEREALEGCLQKLPPAQRELVLTAYTKGTRMDDLAAKRGQTAMSLYKLLHRIRQALHACVQKTIAQENEPA